MSTQALIRTSINPPDELKALSQWMLWRLEKVGDEQNKTPYSPNLLGEFGSSTNPDTWADFKTVHDLYQDGGYSGVAFVMTEQDSIVGIDLDGCFDATGNPHAWAQEILDRFADTYAEISPSGEGIKIFCFGKVHKAFKRDDIGTGHCGIEGYTSGRFFTVTGNLYAQHPRQISACQTQIEWLWDAYAGGNRSDDSFAGFRVQRLPEDLVIREGGRDAFVNNLYFALAYICQNHQDVMYQASLPILAGMQHKRDFPESVLRQKIANAVRGGIKKQRAAAEALAKENTIQLFCPQLTVQEDQPIPVDGKNATWDIGDHIVARIIKHQKSDPSIFNANNELRQIVKSRDGVSLVKCTDHDIQRRMSLASNFTKDNGITPTEAPLKWATHIIQTLDCVRSFPEISSITEAPIYDLESGDVQTETGYNERKRSYYYSPNAVDLNIEDIPSRQAVAEAVKLINERLMTGFNFLDNESSRAGAIAMLCTALFRSSFEEPTPLFLVDAAEAGSGKSYLCRLASWIATGKDLAFSVYSPKPEEFEKKLCSYLLNKPGEIIAFDNITATLNSAEFCQILTAKTYQPRLLGGNEVPTLKNANTWIANGNNVKLGEDLMRRCVHIRIGMSSREGGLEEWVLSHREDVLAAFYTLARHWTMSNHPKADFRLNSFERWSHVIGGMLKLAGIHGLLDESDREASRDILDSQGDEIGEFLYELHAVLGTRSFKTGDLLESLLTSSAYQRLNIRLPQNSRQYNVTSLGRVLHGWTDKTRRGLTLTRERGVNGTSYRLVKKA